MVISGIPALSDPSVLKDSLTYSPVAQKILSDGAPASPTNGRLQPQTIVGMVLFIMLVIFIHTSFFYIARQRTRQALNPSPTVPVSLPLTLDASPQGLAVAPVHISGTSAALAPVNNGNLAIGACCTSPLNLNLLNFERIHSCLVRGDVDHRRTAPGANPLKNTALDIATSERAEQVDEGSFEGVGTQFDGTIVLHAAVQM